MRLSNLSLTVTTVLFLSACGSSSSGKVDHTQPEPAAKQSISKKNPQEDKGSMKTPNPEMESKNLPPKLSTTMQSSENKEISNAAIKINLQGQQGGELEAGDRLENIIYNGQKVTNSKETDLTVKILNNLGEEKGILSYARYGYVEDLRHPNEETVYLFAQGEATPLETMPQNVTATYHGGALYVADKEENDLQNYTSDFFVNFGKNHLEGVIQNANKTVAVLEATIQGNRFTGTSKQQFKTNGQFYGAQAQEIAGSYWNEEKKAGGSFGAKKIDQADK